MAQSVKLFQEFDPVSKEAWKKQILHEMKAATLEEKQALYEQKMIWQPEQNITIQPFYTSEDLQMLPLPLLPVYQPEWQIQETIFFSDEKIANQLAREALSQGTDALCFNLSGVNFSSVNFSVLLQGIKLSDTPVTFSLTEKTDLFIEHLQNIAPYQWKGSLIYNPFTQPGSPVSAIDDLAKAFHLANQSPEFYILTVNSDVFYKADVSVSQQMAYMLANFVEHVHQLTERSIKAEVIFSKTVFSVNVGTNFFMEIAKLRALRLLYAQLATAYQVPASRLAIQAQVWFSTNAEEDQYNNLIRSTLAAMPAVLGGCNMLNIHPYNEKAEDTFARRMARNVSLILKDESYFAQVAGIPDGSYYIENLTYMLAQEAWRLFTEIEAEGGYLQAQRSGLVPQLSRHI